MFCSAPCHLLRDQERHRHGEHASLRLGKRSGSLLFLVADVSLGVAPANADPICPTLRRLPQWASLRNPPDAMISSCRRYLSPPMTTSRACAITTGISRASFDTTRAV